MNNVPDQRPEGETCEAALGRFCTEACLALDEALAQFLAGDDERGPHKARVALRRLTTCLDAFTPLMRQKPLSRLRAEAKSLFRALGNVRDSDVYTLDRSGQSGHAARLHKNRKLREATRARLRREKAVTFAPRLIAAVTPGGALLRRNRKGLAHRRAPVRIFATALLQHLWDAALSFGPSVSAFHPALRHEFRKRLKSLRYLVEFFASHFPEIDDSPFHADFRDLQDALGILNDFEVALAIEGRKRPGSLPEREQDALALSELLWQRLSSAALPWADQPTRLP